MYSDKLTTRESEDEALPPSGLIKTSLLITDFAPLFWSSEVVQGVNHSQSLHSLLGLEEAESLALLVGFVLSVVARSWIYTYRETKALA